MSSRNDALTQFPAETGGYAMSIIVGRLTAFCIHPLVAWPVLSIWWRMAVLTLYAGASFLIVLSGLLLTA